MINLGINEFIRNIKKNILIIILFVSVYVMTILVVSAFVEQYRQFDGVSNVFDDTGIMVYANLQDKEGNPITPQRYKEVLKKVETVEMPFGIDLFESNEIQLDRSSIHLVTYSEKNISYVPRLLAGEWCEDAKTEKGVINAVASNNMPFEIKIGSKVELNGYTFKITGIIGENEPVYGHMTGYDDINSISYLNYYSTINQKRSLGTEYYVLLADYEDMKREYKYPMGLAGIITIDFYDDITKDEIKANIDTMDELFEYMGLSASNYIVETEQPYEHSKQLLDVKLMPMVVILAVFIGILILSMVVSSSINVLYEKKNYGVYFICGNSWKKTFIFSSVSWSMVALTALVVAACICIVISAVPAFKGIVLTFSLVHFLILLAITLVLLMVAFIISYRMLRKIQPVSILKDNDK